MQVLCRNLGVVFRSESNETHALTRISFATENREFVSILGQSGCGKTTLLRCVAGLHRPTEGSVDLAPSPDDPNQDVLIVFQHDGLFPWMRVLENATFGLQMKGVERMEREERARAMLAQFGLKGRERAWPAQLSLGMRQRVALVRAFLCRPALLLMDEPFSALDAQTRLRLQEQLLALWQPTPMSVLFVTHDVDEAILLSDRVLVMDRSGRGIQFEIRIPLQQPRHAEDLTTTQFISIKRKLHEQLGLVSGQPTHA
jgi:ABC-type nitrate/sulfonate/bicarbonate transport system ATPase subunit